jgi:hypothetical protein
VPRITKSFSMQYYLIDFTATINQAVCKKGILRVAGFYSQHNTVRAITQYFYNKYHSMQVEVVIDQKLEVSQEAYLAAAKRSLQIN